MISVLYVDDEPDLLDISKLFLESGGQFQVDTASSAPDGIEMVRSKNYDAIISDYMMPEMDGIEFLKKIRNTGNTIPFIIFTGRGREDVVIEALNAGADFYLQKGGDPEPQFAELKHKLRLAVKQRRADKALQESEQRYRNIFENMQEGFAYCRMIYDQEDVPVDFIYLSVNHSFDRIIGAGTVIGKPVTEVFPGIREAFPQLFEIYGRVARSPTPESFEIEFTPANKWLNVSVYSPERDYFVAVFSDITGRKQAERIATLTYRIHQLAIQAGSLKELLSNFVQEFKQFSGCEAVGIRILDEEGGIPYQAYTGFPAQFYEQESPLNVKSDECMCIYVIKEVLNTSLPVVSPRGSFYCNASSRFLATVPEEERGRTRNVCNMMGYESVALVPIRSTSGILGLIQLNDPRKNMVPLELVQVIEEISPLVGEMVRRIIAEEDLHKTLEDLKTAQNSLQVGLIKYQVLFDSFPLGITVTDAEGKIIESNKTAESLIGLSRAEQEKRKITGEEWSVLRTDGTPMPTEEFPAVRALREHRRVSDVELGLKTPNGDVVWLSITAAPVPLEGYGVVLTYSDISERLNYKRALEESEERYRNVVEDQTEFISRFRPDGTHVFANDAYCRYFGMRREECLGQKFVPKIPPEDRERLKKFFKSLSPDNPVGIIEHRIIMPDGSIRWQRWSDRAIFGDSGNVIEYQSVGRDITENKQIEEDNRKTHEELVASYEQIAADGEELRQNYDELAKSKRDLQEREERYRSFFATSRDCVFITSFDGNWIDFSDSCIQFFGYQSRDELQKVRIMDLYEDPQERKRHLAFIEEKGYSQEYPVNLKKKDGSIINSLITTVPIKGADGMVTGFQGTIRDVTERRKAEEALLRANRQLNLLSSVTRHDILNKVTIILGYTTLLRKNPDPAQIPGLIEKLESAIRTVRDEIEFTRKFQELGVKDPQWMDLNALFPRCRVPPSVTLRHDLPPLEIYADPLISKVFVNLLDNSLVHGEHVTTIRVSGGESPEGFRLIWEDDGVGIPGDEKEKIFLMGHGRNSGFGLFFVREILSITGIGIRETGEQGKGARFEILVPGTAYRFRHGSAEEKVS